MAKIDVLLPVKNGVNFLAESVDSIIGQSFKDWRLLVLDHGSTDGSREMAADYHARDSRIELHSFPEAKGLAGLLNRGLDIADCEYVLRHDADDICLPDRMSVLLAAFEARAHCIAIGGQADVIDGVGTDIGTMHMPIGSARVAVASLFRNPVAHPTSMLRFDDVRRLGVRYGADFLQALPKDRSIEVEALAEDYFLFGQLAILGKCDNVPQNLIRYRRHGGNVSATKFVEQMGRSLQVARFLARSLCAMHGLPEFDPAPFCNHGGELFDIAGQVNFDDEFDRMAARLKRAFGDSPQLERELLFRRTLADRRGARMLWRYNRFRSATAPEKGEWAAVKSSVIRHLPGRSLISITSESAAPD
jgi:glycosyltransferase involved in cell wall biosynthesis